MDSVTRVAFQVFELTHYFIEAQPEAEHQSYDVSVFGAVVLVDPLAGIIAARDCDEQNKWQI